MKIFIDFDDVLFNTKNFIEDIKNIFKKFGISEKIFYETYRDRIRNSDNTNEEMRTYDPLFHFKKIKEKIKIDTKKLENDFNILIKNTSKYIFGDTENFFRNVDKKNIFILSFGTNKFQEEKIINSGIGKYINKIIVVDYFEKAKAIGKVIGKSKEPFCFIDDRVKFLEEVKIKYPFAKTCLFKRKEGRYDDEKNKYCDFEAHNFKEVEKIINNLSY